MGDLTPKLELFLPAGGSTGTIPGDDPADIDKLNENFREIDAAMGAASVTSTTRPPSPYAGQLIYETDTGLTQVRVGGDWKPVGDRRFPNKAARDAAVGMLDGDMARQLDNDSLWLYNGAKWVCRTSGLVRIIPESVAGTGTTLNPDGSVSISGSAAASVNGVMGDFNRVVVKFIGSAAGNAIPALRLRAAGVDISASVYDFQQETAQGTNIATAFVASGTVARLSTGTGVANARLDSSAEIVNGGRAVEKMVLGESSYQDTANAFVTNSYIRNWVRNSSICDGFTLHFSGGTLTGELSVYGYN